ncbi:hypothetical protein BSL78_06066 [Apostichopus japonicus]|uniref:VWFD domain-containing protein n=1 Tax=Stichopus japonicus TaxID=307972 RepID=A0A2G8L9W3_STIJA|nr:hypothetical protein BSL78_06066 [Apostichopus japonicus]
MFFVKCRKANASAPRQCSLLTTLVQRPDGPYFRFPGKGVYSFASDCEDDPLFEVNVQTDITCAGGSKSDCYAIFIRLFDVEIELGPGGRVVCNDVEITNFPHEAAEREVKIFRQGIFTVIEAYNGLCISFNGERTLDMHIPADMSDKVCGLCGSMTFDGTSFFDLENGEQYSLPSFINAMAIGENPNLLTNLTDPCDSAEMKSQAEDRCRFFLEDAKFQASNLAANIQAHFEMCVTDVCTQLGKGDSSYQSCEVAEHFSSTSNNNGGRLEDWRSADFCPYACPSSMVFKECSSCIQSCEAVGFENECSVKCFPGCVCPEGFYFDGSECIEAASCPCKSGNIVHPAGSVIDLNCNQCTCTGGRWSCTTEKCPGECTVFGSGMFKSFDGKWFDTKRQCSYTLVAPTKLAVHKFFIYIDNRGCTNKFTDNCLKEVIVIQGGLRFRIAKNKEVNINGLGVTLPTTKEQFRLSSVAEHFIKITSEFGLEVLVSIELSRVHVKLSKDMQNMVTGVCGNFNENDQDDFFTALGQFPNHAQFLESWEVVIDGVGCLPDAGFAEPLNFNSQSQEYAASLCSGLSSNIFSECSAVVSHTMYYEQCLKDVARGEIFACSGHPMCSSFSLYARECALHGFIVDWIDSTQCVNMRLWVHYKDNFSDLSQEAHSVQWVWNGNQTVEHPTFTAALT